PTTDPDEAIFHGFIQWAGGYKGFGLATVVEVLSGVLSGGLFGTDVPAMKAFGKEPLTTSAFYLSINPADFMPLDEVQARIGGRVRMFKASERAQELVAVFVRGEIEFRLRSERGGDGIPLSGVVYDELRGLAAEAGVGFDLA